jgi:hypothetical protein
MVEKLIAVTKTSSKGPSLRITLPKEIAEILNVGETSHIGFYKINVENAVKKLE